MKAVEIDRIRRDAVFPDRALCTMRTHMMASYVDLLIKTCHRRGTFAMGGMAAQIPIRNDPAANQAALAKVRDDKLREVKAGHDGTWVAHPDLIPIAMEIFNEVRQSILIVQRCETRLTSFYSLPPAHEDAQSDPCATRWRQGDC